MNDFVFHSPTKFVFGRGYVDRTGIEMKQLGFEKVLVVYGQGSVERTGTLGRVLASLDEAGITYVEAGGARPNPEVTFVREAIELARTHEVTGILAVGGGSSIDAAKAVSFGVPYDGDVWDFFAQKKPIEECLPLAVVLTLPAAGSEGSGSCVVSNDAENRKLGVSGDVFRPRLAIMDPELTFTLPAYQTAAGITDMIAHVCERYFSGVGAVPLTDGIACSIIRTLMSEAPKALANPNNYDARANIMWAGTLAHNDLAGCGRSLSPTVRAGGWESHALEHELSAHHTEVTHGAGLAVVMPAWMRHVWRHDTKRFLSFARDVFGIEPEEGYESHRDAVYDAVTSAIKELQNFFTSIGMPKRLREFGLTEDDIEPMLETLRLNKGETFGAFTPLTIEDARAIYESAL
ncbi:MAG: iron-containing alcohol dehydrogenase [Atopobiaceae bacterium]|nr:iron-containing alcohol dehydrogenase [Atopobiaceae bacterium]